MGKFTIYVKGQDFSVIHSVCNEFWAEKREGIGLEHSGDETVFYLNEHNFERIKNILNKKSIKYTLNEEIKTSKKTIWEASFSECYFNNKASMNGFVNTRTVDEVIESDTLELKVIGGSFDEIANRILSIIEYAEKRGIGMMDNKVNITFNGDTLGFQFCPFEKCNRTWHGDIYIRNPSTEKRLVINRGLEHLIRDHHLLEKGNMYGITAREFYEHFMP